MNPGMYRLQWMKFWFRISVIHNTVGIGWYILVDKSLLILRRGSPSIFPGVVKCSNQIKHQMDHSVCKLVLWASFDQPPRVGWTQDKILTLAISNIFHIIYTLWVRMVIFSLIKQYFGNSVWIIIHVWI